MENLKKRFGGMLFVADCLTRGVLYTLPLWVFLAFLLSTTDPSITIGF